MGKIVLDEKRMKIKPTQYNAGDKVKIGDKDFEVPEDCIIVEYLPDDVYATSYTGEFETVGLKKHGNKVIFTKLVTDSNPFELKDEIDEHRIDAWKNILEELLKN